MIYEVGYIPIGMRFGKVSLTQRAAAREKMAGSSRVTNRSRLLLDEHDARGLACEVVDVSAHGCRVALGETRALLALRKIGAECILELDGETWVRVRVCWFAQQFRGLKIIRKLERK
jgi:hypothetical protein